MKRIGFLKALGIGLWATGAFSAGLAHAQTTPNATPLPAPTPVAPAAPAPTPQGTPPAPRPGGPQPTPTPVQDPRGGDTPGAVVPKAAGTPGVTPAATPQPTGTPAPKTIADITKGFDKVDGFFTLYRKVDNNRQRLLAEIKESQIGPLFILQTTFASGNAERITAGRPVGDTVWRWKRTPDDRLIVDVPNLWFRSTDPNLKNAVERDFPDAYLDVYPILAKSKEKGTVLIDFSSFFDGGIPGLDTALDVPPPLRAERSAYALDPQLSFLESIKNFPSNMVVEANYHYRRLGNSPTNNETQADPRSLPIQVVYNLYGLPENNGYRPRLADPRVGYFVNGQLSAGRAGFETFDDDSRADPRVVYINRWNLQKADPSAKLSPPVKPIVFTIDTTVPQRYRPAMREGILSWNRAFEPLGFQNAIVVREAPMGKGKDAEDYDHADMRFNTLRWVASPPTDNSAYAVALLRENPLTGEIINASITVNANFARIAFREKQNVINPLAGNEMVASQDANQSFVPGAACALTAQMADPRFADERYVDDLLRATVAHEFGHILGLRHNFIASTFESPQALANPAKVRRDGISASVMDYVGFNVFGLKTKADLFARGPGIYDYWALQYGYTPFAVGSEKANLQKIAARATEPGHAFSSDEQADDYDPTVVRYDLSSDPLAYTEKSFGVTDELLRTLPQQLPKPGENYATFTTRLRSLLLRSKPRDANIVARYVGGFRVRRIVRGDKTTNQPFSPVPVSQQRRALALLNQEIFAPTAFDIPANYLNKTAPDPFDPTSPIVDAAFPFRDEIASVRATLLAGLLAPIRLRRISNGEWKFPGQVLPMSELFPTLRQGVWGTLTPKTAFTALQRDLAYTHVRLLTNLATDKVSDAPNDARLLAGAELRALQSALKAPSQSSPDVISRLFFVDTLRRIDAALKKKPE